WYNHVAPFSWLLARDVREGRAELNFSTWNQYSTQRQVKKLQESWKEVSEGDMPPWYYVPVHRHARLSAEDRTALRTWAAEYSYCTDRQERQVSMVPVPHHQFVSKNGRY